ncbi:protein of unknown function [Streptomyces murinus]
MSLPPGITVSFMLGGSATIAFTTNSLQRAHRRPLRYPSSPRNDSPVVTCGDLYEAQQVHCPISERNIAFPMSETRNEAGRP